MKNARTKFGAPEQGAVRRGRGKWQENSVPDDSGKGIKISPGWSFTLCLLIVLVVAGFASIYAATGVNSPWYNYVKSTITPPGYVFSIIWTALYFLLALSMYLSLISTQGNHRKIVAFLFALNLFFNGIWSFLFFGLQNSRVAFFDLVLLFLSTIAIMILMVRTNKNISWLGKKRRV